MPCARYALRFFRKLVLSLFPAPQSAPRPFPHRRCAAAAAGHDDVTVEYDSRIEKLEARLRQLKVRKQRVDARRRALDSKRTRREETRRKILVGTVVLMQVDRGTLQATVLRQWLDSALTRADERRLFGL